VKLTQNWRILLSLLGLALFGYVLYQLLAILTYLLIAVVVSFICEPVSDLLRKVRIGKMTLPASFRALITLFAFVGVLVGLAMLFLPLLSQEIALIASIDPNQFSYDLEQRIRELQNSGAWYSNLLGNAGITESAMQYTQNVLSFSWVQDFLVGVFGWIGSIGVAVFSILFMTFFFLKDTMLFSRMVIVLTPELYMEKVKDVLNKSHKLLRKYFVGLALQSLIMMAMVSIGLKLLGVENAMLIGFLSGMLNVIPYLGPLSALILGVLVTISTSLHLDLHTELMPLVAKVSGVFLLAQLLDAFLIQPLVVGGSVKAHPLETYIVILAAGSLGGPLAMMLAIPAYTILRVIAREFFNSFKVVKSLTRKLDSEGAEE
jgi:predicted PurR-regulated permease PerM